MAKFGVLGVLGTVLGGCFGVVSDRFLTGSGQELMI